MSSASQQRHFLLRRDNRAMIAAAEVLPDFAVGCARVLACQIHGEHSWIGVNPLPFLGKEQFARNAEYVAEDAFDVGQGHEPQRMAQQIAEGAARGPIRCRSGVRPRARNRATLSKRTFQLAHVAAQMLGEEVEHFGRHSAARRIALARRISSRVGRSGVAKLQTAPPARRSVNSGRKSSARRRMAIARQHHGALARHQRIERVQEFFLRGFFLGEEADVVHQEGIAFAELLAKAAQLVLVHRRHEAVGEILRGQEEDAAIGKPA